MHFRPQHSCLLMLKFHLGSLKYASNHTQWSQLQNPSHARQDGIETHFPSFQSQPFTQSFLCAS